MRIDTGHGRTPLWVAARPRGGVTITQGSSHLLMSAEEIELLFDAIDEMCGPQQ